MHPSNYGNATSSVHINGYRTGKFPVNCSVWQGCPLSMQLLAIWMDPLLFAYESTLLGIHVGRKSHKSAVIAYADDVTLLLTSPSEIRVKINIQKSKAMAVGMWDKTVNIMGLPYYESMKILGMHFTSTTSQSALKSWSAVTDGYGRKHAKPTTES